MILSDCRKALEKQYENAKMLCPKCAQEMTVKILDPHGFGSTTFKINYCCMRCTPYPLVKPVITIYRQM